MSVIKKTKNNYKTKSRSNKSSTSRKYFNKSRNSRNSKYKTRKMRGGTRPLTKEEQTLMDELKLKRDMLIDEGKVHRQRLGNNRSRQIAALQNQINAIGRNNPNES